VAGGGARRATSRGSTQLPVARVETAFDALADERASLLTARDLVWLGRLFNGWLADLTAFAERVAQRKGEDAH